MSTVKIIELRDTYLVTQTESDIFYSKMNSVHQGQNGSVASSVFLECLCEKFEKALNDGA